MAARAHLPPPVANGMTIRGLAGPYVVMAQNFAPGTTAADIESAMMPVGGMVNKCRILKTHPITIAEVEFQTKEGADRVIESFNNQLVGLETFPHTIDYTEYAIGTNRVLAGRRTGVARLSQAWRHVTTISTISTISANSSGFSYTTAT